MDEYSRKRSAGGFGFSKRSSSLTFREPNHEDQSVQYCNRLGCSTRLNSLKGIEDKPKYLRTSFRSMSNKSIGGSSSKPLTASTESRKSHQERPNQTSSQDAAEASNNRRGVAEVIESNDLLGDTEGSEFRSTITGIPKVLSDPDDVEPPTVQRLPTSSKEPFASRSRKQVSRVGLNSQNSPNSSSSVRRSTTIKSTGQSARPSQYLASGPPRYGLRNLDCSSISDILPSGCSELAHSKRGVSVRKRPSDGESSSSGGKSALGSSSGSSNSSHSGTNGPSLPQQTARRARNGPLSRDGPVSVRTRRAPGGETRVRVPEQQGEDALSMTEPILYSQLPDTQLSTPEVALERPSRSFPMEPPPIFPSSFSGRPSSSSRSAQSRLFSFHHEDSSSHGPLVDRDGHRRFNMEGIAEVLLALERIEQDDELSYEQLLVLEANLLFGSVIHSHDRHRDMRLDIDNMSYEELLALEEKMGTVSTALSEEALSTCIKRSSYVPVCEVPGIDDRGVDDAKCSVCQEEYTAGDELGKLVCEHRYHTDCIQQWLRQKNWCPICKSSVVPHKEETKD